MYMHEIESVIEKEKFIINSYFFFEQILYHSVSLMWLNTMLKVLESPNFENFKKKKKEFEVHVVSHRSIRQEYHQWVPEFSFEK